VKNPANRCRGIAEVVVDGEAVSPDAIPLSDDGRSHRVEVTMGDRAPEPERPASARTTAGGGFAEGRR
jgi:hypothetical protein